MHKEEKSASFPFCQELAAKLKLWPKSGVKKGGGQGIEEGEMERRMERKDGEGAKYCERNLPELFLERWNTQFTLEIRFSFLPYPRFQSFFLLLLLLFVSN